MTDYSNLLKKANETNEMILEEYICKAQKQERKAFSNFEMKNIKVGMVNNLLEETERKYFDKWYENSIYQPPPNYTFLPYCIYEFHATDFIVLVESTNKKRPLLIKKTDLIRHGLLVENTQNKSIECLFFFVLNKHREPSSFYSNFYKTGNKKIQYVNNIYYVWMNKEFKISFTEEGGLETIREVTPHQLIYNFENNSLKTIEMIFKINMLGFIVKTGYTKIKWKDNQFGERSGLLYTDNSYCKIISVVFDVTTEKLSIEYFDDTSLEIVDSIPKINFVCNNRGFKNVSSLCHGYFLNNINRKSEIIENLFNEHVGCLLDQIEHYLSHRNYLNAFELFHEINTAEICDDMNKKRVKKMIRQWCFKAPSTRAFAMICLTDRGGLPRLPIEIIEYIIKFLVY